jgi:hypothetical protein
MARKFGFVAFLIIVLVIIVLIISAFLITSIIDENVSVGSSIKVGVYYYGWYGNGGGGLGSSHWNCSGNIVVDTPTIGFYDSANPVVINTQLGEMKSLDIDFIIASWWGKESWNGTNSYVDNATKLLFEALKANSTLQAIIMAEPFYYGTATQYNFSEIYDYIYDTYVTPYPNVYMTLYGKPLLCFFQEDQNFTHPGKFQQDAKDRFTVRIVGHANYCNWTFWSFDSKLSQPWKAGTQPLNIDGHINVCPRYDDYYQRGTVPPYVYYQFDVNYTEGLYDEQWAKAISLAREGQVNIVTISTWNDYHERTQIEPCIDRTSAFKSDPYYIYNKTKEYISLLRSPIIKPEVIAVLGTLLILLVVLIFAFIKIQKRSVPVTMEGKVLYKNKKRQEKKVMDDVFATLWSLQKAFLSVFID